MNKPSRREKRDYDLTKPEIAEIEATTLCLQAEARQANAEAALAEAETLRATILAEAERCGLAERKAQHAAAMSGDVHHQVYRYTEDIDGETVADCMAHLALWHRSKSGCDMEIVFTCEGGDIISGLALYDYIQAVKRQGHKIITKTYGMAASMAGVLLQTGTERVSGKEAWVLIHEGSFGAKGDAGKVEDMVNWGKRIRERIVNIFAERAAEATEKPAAQIATFIRKNWTRRDWWLDSTEMLKHGFVDFIE